MRILIAEDDPISRNILMSVLKQMEHEVVETVDGVQAWAEFQRSDAPNMIILDWMMPEMDGIEVVRHIRSLKAANPPYIVMLTANSKKSDIVEALEAGANDYVTKPFDASELRARVEVGCRMVEMQAALTSKVKELSKALADIKTLQGIIPICSNCKSIRDDEGAWHQMEAYVSQHSEAKFSHSYCAKCVRELFPEMADHILNDREEGK